METKPLEVYSVASNFGIVRMPGRNFPGCVIQGDSLKILWRKARSVLERLGTDANEELREDAADLVEALDDRLKHYESVLAEHGFELPYPPRK